MSIAQLTQALVNQPDIEVLIAFGSVAAGTARPDSDIDMAIQLSTPFGIDEKMRLIEAITLATGRPVDLVDLRTVGEPLLGEILAHGQWLRGSTYQRYLLMQRHVYAMEDFMPQVEQMLQQRRHAWLGAMNKAVVNRKLDSLQHCLQRVRDRCPADLQTLATDPDSQDIVVLNLRGCEKFDWRGERVVGRS